MSPRTVLVVAAHPDDETLGCGGSLALHALRGDSVHALFLTDGVGSRQLARHTAIVQRRSGAKVALQSLGVSDATFLDLPDNEMDRVSLLEIVQRIEPVIDRIKPNVVFTHHAGDLNIDHRLTHQAVMTALRPQPGRLAPAILCFEVASSTEWQSPLPHLAFLPNWFQDISDVLDRKLRALEHYQIELRQWPHSRSIEAVMHLARWRGASIGVEAAEAFMLARFVSR